MKTFVINQTSKQLKIVAFFLLSFLCSEYIVAQVYVQGYYRKDGTYVKSHYRSSPDSNPYNNYSYPGNTNPYTGKVATGNPDTYLKNYYRKPKSSNSYSTYNSSITYPNNNTNIYSWGNNNAYKTKPTKRNTYYTPYNSIYN